MSFFTQRESVPQGCDGEMLRRRRNAQTKAAGETKGRQEENEAHWQRRAA